MTAYGAGELTERVTFKREVSVSDGVSGYDQEYQTICTAYALVRPMSGREREQANMIHSSGNYLIVIRYRDDIFANCIAEWRGRTLNIRFVKDRGPRSLYLEMEAEMGVGT